MVLPLLYYDKQNCNTWSATAGGFDGIDADLAWLPDRLAREW
jgi:hypothetical protein